MVDSFLESQFDWYIDDINKPIEFKKQVVKSIDYDKKKKYKYLEKVSKHNEQHRLFLLRLESYKKQFKDVIDVMENYKGAVGLSDKTINGYMKTIETIVENIYKKENQKINGNIKVLFTGLKKRITEWLNLRKRLFPEQSEQLEKNRHFIHELLSFR